VAGAANALLLNTARVAGNDGAFLHALERAQGAYAASNAAWDKKQSALAARYAREEAKLLEARPGLEAALRRAVEAAGGAGTLTVADVKRAQRGKLPAALVSLFRSFGLSPGKIAAFQARIAKVKPASAAGPVAPKLAPPAVAAAERAVARLLRTAAARLAKR
jgi:hypothetical protein